MNTPRPLYSVTQAVQRAMSVVNLPARYELGTGDYDTTASGPWDCFGFAYSWCYGVKRHRPGFNRGAWATVTDDMNCNSAIEDADHDQDLFEPADTPFPGALILYPTITLPNHPGMKWIGHVKMVIGVSRAGTFKIDRPDWSLLDTIECCGPNDRSPAVIAGNGSAMNGHDHDWPKPEHCTRMIRAKP